MKNVYIVTFYRSMNYGSRLQALALYTAIEQLGYQAHMVKGSFSVREVLLRHPRMLWARLYNKLNSRKRKQFFRPSPYVAWDPDADQFLADNFREVTFQNAAEWQSVKNDVAAFVVGSDIVWQPQMGYPSRYFLDFAVLEGLPCFSYAPSVGAGELPRRFYGAYRRYLRSYKGIGVREEASAELLRPVVGLPIVRNVDPTLLLEAREWDLFAQRADHLPDLLQEGYAFCYFVMDDPRYWEYVAKVQEATGLQVVVLPMHFSDEGQPYTVITDKSPYTFISLIKHAELVVTDSFHVCSFCLTYEKEFYLLRRARKAEDSKFDELLNRYHLRDREVTDEETFERVPACFDEQVKGLLAEDRARSRAFLSKSLEACERSAR